MKKNIVTTCSPEETEAFAESLAKSIKVGQVIALQGTLGMGKTCFTRGLAKGLACEDLVNSPTYVLMQEYQGRIPLYHCDLYRLDSAEQFWGLGAEDWVWGDGVTVIEWPDKVLSQLPDTTLIVKFEAGDQEKVRTMTLESKNGSLEPCWGVF